jgi:hypothetical protein
MPTSDIVKSDIGLLALGKSDFDAIEPFRNGRYFREALHIGKMPSSAWMRQRMEGMEAALHEERDAYSVRLLRNAEAPSRRWTGPSAWTSTPSWWTTAAPRMTGIEIAGKVRSYQGLLVHVFGRLAAAMFFRNRLMQSA